MRQRDKVRLAAVLTALFAALLTGSRRDAHSSRIENPELCDRDSVDQRLGPSKSLFCVELIPVPDLRQVSGTVELHRAPSPFTVAVDAEGHHQYELVVALRDLPESKSLGPYSTYVAWLTTPSLTPEVKLGEVRGGRTRLGVAGFDKFVVLITAEASSRVAKRSGRMVLRATSPSWLLLPHDASKLPAQSRSAEHAHHGTSSGGWAMPAMHPQVPTMVAGLEMLTPPVTAWRPGAGRDSARIPTARPREIVTLKDGDSLDLTAGLVRRTIAGRSITMYGFNGQSPGPLLHVVERSTVVVKFKNELDQPTSVHWHGVRLDNRFDGVPHVTQELVQPGATFRYTVRFPDAGIYWYHPHHREDTQQDLGLYGNLFVRSTRPDFFAPVNREEVLMLDDLLLDADDSPVPHGAEAATHALMGRFGNVFLVNGSPEYRLHVSRGAVVRFFFTNASNTRVFNVVIPGARMKLVGSDVGKPEREAWVPSVVLAPAERFVVDVRFESAGTIPIVNAVRAIDHFAGRYFSEADTLGLVAVDETPASPNLAVSFANLRTNREVIADIDRYRSRFTATADRTLLLTLDVAKTMPFGLVQALRVDTGYVNPVEWSGTMPMMDWLSTARDVRWVLREPSSGRENMDVAWRFRVGQLVRLRLVNDRHTLHPMHHPVHIHGQRFLVLAVNGDPMQNLMWKDTVLIPAGSAVDLLVEMTNPGRWMLHCHIAEHLESGMHTVFEVIR